MLLAIHDANLKKVAFIDNEKQDTLNYFDDVWTRNLETGSSTFEFTVFKKSIDKAYSYLNEKAFVSFKYNGKSYVFNAMTVEENEQTIACYCENLNLELINEYTNAYKATKAMSFVEYCNAMGLLSFTYLSIGINEISDQKRTLEWEGQDTKLARLLSLANKFDAEIDFDTQLNADSTIKSFKVNVYHENDGTHQGVGRIRNDIRLTYGKNFKSITRKIDKTNVVNAIRPTGTKDGQTVVISGLSAWEEKNADGIVEFYQKGEMLYAPISMQMYPSTFTSETIQDQWTRKDITVDSDNPTVIRSVGIRELRKNAYPAITYDVDGFVDVEIGDTVKIHDDGFNPVLIVEARVSDQKISFTNPASNKTTFANFKALENQLSDGIQERLNELVEQAKPYTIKLSTNNGVVFKNNIGQSIITPSLYKGGKPVVANVTWRWALDGNATTGMTYTVRGADVTDTATLTVSAYVGNDDVATDEVSFVNVFDGTNGKDGVAGKDGVGIKTTVITYAISTSGTSAPSSGWTNSVPSLVKGQYLWTKTVWTYTDNSTETGYSATYISKDGNNGTDGIAGKDGVGIKTTTITYAKSTNGTTAPSSGWTASVPNAVAGDYIWTKTVWVYTDNTTETGYSVGKIGNTGPKGDTGADGIAGKDGKGITGTVITYGISASETTQPSTWTASVPTLVKGQYLWTKTVWTYTDNTNETGYTKTYISKDGNNGTDGIAGKDGIGISSTAITYASSSSGTSTPTSGWSTSVPTVSPGMFLWTKTVWSYTDNTTETGYSVARMGTPGADGRTTYPHYAFSDNADGTGLTFTDTGQRYQGYYSDFTQADSTDKTKYRWADRWAKIEVGSKNYIRDFGFANSRTFNNNQSFWRFERIADSTARSGYHIKATCTQSGGRGFHRVFRDLRGAEWQGRTMTYAVDVKASKSVRMLLGVESFNKGYKTFDATTEWQRFISTDTVNFKNFYSFPFYTDSVTWDVGDVVYLRDPQLEDGTVATTPRAAEEDVQSQIDSKADQAKVVYKTDISVTDEGIIHSASKTVNGQTIASMIAQRAEWVEIIANLLKVKGDMIVNGTIGADKLSVSTMSALTADLGQISGGSLELLESVAQGTSVDAWGNFTIPAHKWGIYIDNIGAISSGTPVRKSSSESVASDMPIAVLTSGQLGFAMVDRNNDLESVLHYGLSDPDNAIISFGVASDGTKQLLIQANGQIVNQGTNYTGWTSTGVAGVFYKRQGDVVAIKMQVTTTANQQFSLGKIPISLVPIPNSGTMMRVTAWTADQTFGRNLQINSDGSMSLLVSNRGDTFNTQVTWII